MATPQNNPTGGNNLSREAASAASNLAGPALDLAQGATAFQAATNALKGAALDKLLGPTAVFAGGMIGVLRTIKSIVEQSGLLERGLKRIASLQQIQGKFETLLKSAEAANKRIKELYKFTASSPFDFSEVAAANRTLEALTQGAYSSAEAMRVVGDVAAATGRDLGDVANSMGKLYAGLRSGRSLDKVLFQLQGMGAVTDTLASRLETLNQAGAGFNEMWAEVTKSVAFTDGAMKAEMKTLDGLRKRLSDASAMMEKAFATPFVEAQAKSIETTIKATQQLTPVLAKIGEDVAPLVTFFREVKNEVAVATIATKGFAEALGIAWTAAKTLFTGAATAVLASMVANLLKAAWGAKAYAAGLAAASAAATASAASVAGLQRATALATAATTAFQSQQYLSALSLKAQSLWATVSTAALNVHAVALARATTATGAFSATNYALAASAQVAGGALSLLGRAVTFVLGGLKAFAIANPLLVIGAGVAAAVAATASWANAQAKVNEEYTKTIRNLEAVRAGIRKQISEVRNLDQYRQAILDTEKKIADEEDAIAGMQRPSTTRTTMDATGRVRTEEWTNDPQAVVDFDNELNERQRTLAEAKRRLTGLLNRDKSTLGLGAEEQAKLGDRVVGDLATADATRQAGAANADDRGRLAFMRRERARLAEEARIGREIDLGRTSKERLAQPTELQKVSEQIAAAEKAGRVVDPALNRRRAELGVFAESFAQKEAQIPGIDAEIKQLENAIRLKEIELDFDLAIAQARASGHDVSLAAMNKELAILREQLRIAREKGEAGKQEARDVAARMAAVDADRAEFRIARGIERAENNAVINGKPKAAQALEDAAEIRRMEGEYAANGLDPAQARADFENRIRAEAMAAGPRIVTDSKQAIGGGGGFQASDPIASAQKRAADAAAAAVPLLQIIARNTAQGPVVN